jgi:hypothetical protein
MDFVDNLRTLGLQVTDPDLRAKLKLLRKANHPDATGGEFKTEDQKASYHAAEDALGELENSNGSETGTELQILPESHRALVQTNKALQKLLEERERNIETVAKQKAASSAEQSARTAINQTVKRRYSPFSIGGFSAAGIAAAIVLLDKPLGGFLEELFQGDAPDAHYAKLFLGALAVTASIFALVAKREEAKRIERITATLSEAGIENLFYSYDYIIFDDSSSRDSKKVFSVFSLALAISEYCKIDDKAMCEATAEAIIKKLEQRGIIQPIVEQRISTRFSMDEKLLQNTPAGRYWEFQLPNDILSRARSEARRLRDSIKKLLARNPGKK